MIRGQNQAKGHLHELTHDCVRFTHEQFAQAVVSTGEQPITAGTVLGTMILL